MPDFTVIVFISVPIFFIPTRCFKNHWSNSVGGVVLGAK
jgi:hypothetical protein